MESTSESPRAATGIRGLDEVLGGGLPRNRVYLVEGDPGCGKTTLALQFLLEGRRNGEAGVHVTLSETGDELRGVATSHGWSLDDLAICELAREEQLRPDAQYTLFHPSEVELGETTRQVLEHVERARPSRVVFDSLAEMRLLARDPLRFRRQILALKQFFVGRQCTVLLIDDRSSPPDAQVHSLVNGVVSLERVVAPYGSARRRLQITKLRGVDFRTGYHDFDITTGGLVVFPRLLMSSGARPPVPRRHHSGVPEVDALLGGGLESGLSTLLIGPAGVGKSVLALQYAFAAADRGERSAIFLLDESLESYLARARGLGMSLEAHLESGRMEIHPVHPVDTSPGKFAHMVREAVEVRQAGVVVVDSLNGYLYSMPDEHLLIGQMHELLAFLGARGVLTLLVVAQAGIIGGMTTPVDVTYLADTVILLRYFEAAGSVRQAVSVVKKRSGRHERTIRELRVSGHGLQVGQPLEEFQGVLTGVPTYTGATGGESPLLQRHGGDRPRQ